MKYLISFFPSILSFSLASQVDLSGNVMSSITKEPVEFALVSLFPADDSSLVVGDLTAANGSFTFSNLKSGDYSVSVQMLGFQDWSKVVSLDSTIQLAPISLVEESEVLNEVEIVAQQSAVESHIGKKTLLLGQDITTTGANALEALEIIPSVTTNSRGQIQIRGNSNVVIYINGKATKRDPATLKFISAKSLEKIEIITNPSSKYDAEGVGGIINIVYKKSKSGSFKMELITGISVLTDPKYSNFNGGVNLSYSKDRFSIYSIVSTDHGKYQDRSNSNALYFQDSIQSYENLAFHIGKGTVTNALLGCSFEPDTTTSVGIEINFDRWDFDNDIQQQNYFDYKFIPDENVTLYGWRHEIEDELWVNVSGEKVFSKNKELKLSFTVGGEDEANLLENEEQELTDLPKNVEQFLRYSDESESQRYYQV